MTLRQHFAYVLIYSFLVIVAALSIAEFIPYLGNFSYPDIIELHGVPWWLNKWASFDGAHYLHIALQGYHQYDQAFFPGYITLIYSVGLALQNNHVLSALLISWNSFAFGSYLFYQLCKVFWGESIGTRMLSVLLAFPMSFFFYAAYAESLFLLLTCAAILSFQKGKFTIAAICGLLAATVRLQGILIIPLFILMWFGDRKKPVSWVMMACLGPAIGLGLYMGYLWWSTGDPLYFFTSQPFFGAQRSTSLIPLPQVYFRYAKIFLQSQLTFQYVVALLEVFMASFALLAAVWHMRYAYQRYSFNDLAVASYSAMHVILPALTGTFSSMPRYVLFSFSLYFIVAQIKNKPLFIGVVTLMLICQLVIAGFFLQGYFVS